MGDVPFSPLYMTQNEPPGLPKTSTPVFQGTKARHARHASQNRGTELIPRMFKELLKCSGCSSSESKVRGQSQSHTVGGRNPLRHHGSETLVSDDSPVNTNKQWFPMPWFPSGAGFLPSTVGVLFRRAWLKLDGFHWFRSVLFHVPGPSICPKGHLWSKSEFLAASQRSEGGRQR